MKSVTPLMVLHLSLLVLVGSSCVGEIIGKTVASNPSTVLPVRPQACQETPNTSSGDWATFRQLTQNEFEKTVESMLGADVTLTQDLPSDATTREESGVTSNIGVSMTDQRFAIYSTVAQRIGDQTAASLQTSKNCVITSRDTANCLDNWVSNLGKRAFRRPLTADEKSRIVSMSRGETDTVAAASMVIQAILLSPQFLFHVELGDRSQLRDGRVPLTAYELATRLSYFVTGAPPSAELVAAAENNQLLTDTGIAEWTNKLLKDTVGRNHQIDSVMQWLDVSDLTNVTKSTTTYPQYTDAVKSAMGVESRTAVEAELFNENNGFSSMIASTKPYFTSTMNPIYSYAMSPSMSASDMMTTARRAGPFMQAAWLAKHSNATTSPTKRGRFFTQRVLCQPVSLPPPSVEVPPLPPDDGTLTTRERMEPHGQLSCAAACHSVMDPIGFAFESFDPIGRYRTTENNKPVNTTGTVSIMGTKTSFRDAQELVSAVASSGAFHECVAEQWVERAIGVAPRSDEKCDTEDLGTKFKASGGKVDVLLTSIAQSYIFRSKGVCSP